MLPDKFYTVFSIHIQNYHKYVVSNVTVASYCYIGYLTVGNGGARMSNDFKIKTARTTMFNNGGDYEESTHSFDAH